MVNVPSHGAEVLGPTSWARGQLQLPQQRSSSISRQNFPERDKLLLQEAA